MTQKGLAPILIVLILAALVGGFLVYQNQSKPASVPTTLVTQPSPTPDETANWKTYKSACGFSLQYPTDYQILEQTPDCLSPLHSDYGGEIIKEGMLISSDNRKTMILTILVNIKPKTQNFSEVINMYYKQYFSTEEERKVININGLQAVKSKVSKYVQGDNTPGDGQYVLIKKDEKLYLFMISTDEGRLDIWDQILSTFKFLP